MIDTDVTPVTKQVEADIAAAEVPIFVVDSGILDVNDYSDVREVGSDCSRGAKPRACLPLR